MDKNIKVIGILGGNHFAYFLKKAAQQYNVEIIAFDWNKNCPFAKHGKIHAGDFNNIEDLNDFFNKVDFVVVATQRVNFDLLYKFKKSNKIWINEVLLSLVKNRLSQKEAAQYLQIPYPRYLSIKNKEDFLEKYHMLSFPCVLKALDFNLHGEEIAYIPKIDSLDFKEKAIIELSKKQMLAEEYIKCVGEFSVTICRDRKQNNVFGNFNWNIYYTSTHFISQPNFTRKKIVADSKAICNKLLDFINLPGVYTVKFFEKDKLKIFLNEITPLLHNSANHGLENLQYTQFNYLLRIILNLPIEENPYKLQNLAYLNVTANRYERGKQLAKEIDIINFYDYGKDINKCRDREIVAHIIMRRNPKNHKKLSRCIRELHDFAKK